MRYFLLSCSALFLLSGCASIVSGKSQEITLDTTPPGANCNLNRDGKFLAGVPQTPGTVKVEKTKDDIEVVCQKPQYTQAKENLDSGTDGWVFGNVLLGGLIGWGVDSAVGADNKYPEKVAINMSPMPVQQTQQQSPFGYSSMAPAAGAAPAGWIVGPPGIPQSNAYRMGTPAVAAPVAATPTAAPIAIPPQQPSAPTH